MKNDFLIRPFLIVRKTVAENFSSNGRKSSFLRRKNAFLTGPENCWRKLMLTVVVCTCFVNANIREKKVKTSFPDQFSSMLPRQNPPPLLSRQASRKTFFLLVRRKLAVFRPIRNEKFAGGKLLEKTASFPQQFSVL